MSDGGDNNNGNNNGNNNDQKNKKTTQITIIGEKGKINQKKKKQSKRPYWTMGRKGKGPRRIVLDAPVPFPPRQPQKYVMHKL